MLPCPDSISILILTFNSESCFVFSRIGICVVDFLGVYVHRRCSTLNEKQMCQWLCLEMLC